MISRRARCVVMRPLIRSALLALVTSACADSGGRGYPSVAAPGRADLWTIVRPAEVQDMRHRCAGRFSKGLAGSWEPTKAEVAKAERKLPDAIDAAFDRVKSTAGRHRPDRYYRQYGGFLRDGKRVLCVNAFEEGEGADSGTGSFVAVFDLEKDAFDSFSFDGQLSGPVRGGHWEARTP
jgi:hypothetical protein